MQFVVSLLLGALVLLTISLQRTYGHIPEKELKRRARSGDAFAKSLYRAAAYGSSLRALLWVCVIFFAAVFFVYVSRNTATWFGFLSSAFVVWFGFLWLPAQDATRVSMRLASQVAPVFAWILEFLHPVLERITRFIQRHRPIRMHTGLYDKDDLLRLFKQQQVQGDNRVDDAALDIARHALLFADKQVQDIVIPRRVVRLVSADESVGPVLITELHETGFSRFPVYEGKKDNLVGVLYLRDLIRTQKSGSVRSVMHGQICFVHEDQPLSGALQAILKTHQQLFAVVNSFEEFIGIVTIEDILEQIVGKQIIDEFDQYDDLRAVAAHTAKKEHDTHVSAAKKTEKPLKEITTNS